jgi:FliP family
VKIESGHLGLIQVSFAQPHTRNRSVTLIPSLTIDMVVASVLMSLGMMMLPPSVVSLPFKLIFFVMVDGWRLVSGSLVQSFNGTGP